MILASSDPTETLARALRSVLENRDPRFDVWIVDMGWAMQPVDALHALLRDPRVHRVRCRAAGSSAAHNEAIAAARGEILAITDHDCEVSTTWVEEMIRAFDHDARIGVVFGDVAAAHPGDASTPEYRPAGELLARNVRDKSRVEGIWACMGVRRSTWESLSGFDERFGKGARFPGCADADLAIRALAAGTFVFETPRISVLSHRVLPAEEHRRAVAGYTYASGALLGSHLRRRTPGSSRLAAALARRWAEGRAHGALGSAPLGRWRRLAAFCHGVAHGALERGGPPSR
ncbi:MAG TPA: glycosyltransferase [Gemmatimonadota bacterium]|nr:glycosyltransferase [Gemmatimonadota bacterium]